MIRGIILILSIAGFANACYFTFAYYGKVRGVRWIPAVLCARDGSSCLTVVQTPYARVLGPPNSLLGIIYYLLVVAWALAEPAGTGWLILLLAMSASAVVLGGYLIYALRHKLHVDCPLCYAAHAANAALFAILLDVCLRAGR
ncbi:MAG TPA: vitamin K epoxide reductase family protein [Terriglobia bacterium]|nr:vitamin K epoxide reductase family protein [Terriglobia bacterium]